MGSFSAVILAAGQGKRTGLPYPKVLHPLCGKPMLAWVQDTLKNLKPQQLITVVPPNAKTEIAKLLKNSTLAIQDKPLGTGHALRCAITKLKRKSGTLLVACGDTPLFTQETFSELFFFHQSHSAAATILTTELPNPTGYGRIVRNEYGEVQKIVEEKDATESEREIHEINSGTYVFDLEQLVESFPSLNRDNAQHEYYLTDCIGWLVEHGRKVFASTASDATSALGVNTLKELGEASRILNHRLEEHWLKSGVMILDPNTVYLDADIHIGAGTTLYPFTFIEKGTRIGRNCQIGPFARIQNSELGDDAAVGPFAYLRPGSKLGSGVKVGDFVEIKNSSIGSNSKVPHLSYVGDAILGTNVNIGAGTITCNYDGRGKHRTVIENGAFIGSNTNLVAPVRVGKKATTGAGSVVTQNVKANTVVAGVPAREIKKIGTVPVRGQSRRRNQNGG